VVRDLTGATDFLEVNLATGSREQRLAVFARHQSFGKEEFGLLAECQETFATIDRHAVRLESIDVGPSAELGQPQQHTSCEVSASGPRDMMTRREIDVLTLLHQGLKVGTMASRLGISPRTANKHLANAYRKLGAHDRLMAVRKAQSLGVLPPE